jgi:hypothetical protein
MPKLLTFVPCSYGKPSSPSAVGLVETPSPSSHSGACAKETPGPHHHRGPNHACSPPLYSPPSARLDALPVAAQLASPTATSPQRCTVVLMQQPVVHYILEVTVTQRIWGWAHGVEWLGCSMGVLWHLTCARIFPVLGGWQQVVVISRMTPPPRVWLVETSSTHLVIPSGYQIFHHAFMSGHLQEQGDCPDGMARSDHAQ